VVRLEDVMMVGPRKGLGEGEFFMKSESARVNWIHFRFNRVEPSLRLVTRIFLATSRMKAKVEWPLEDRKLDST
jgi:hypothetical protein